MLEHAGHEATRLREVLDPQTTDAEVLEHAHRTGAVLVTCNRDDFLSLARTQPHAGIIVLIRRESRLLECSAFLGLLDRAGDTGIRSNINFAQGLTAGVFAGRVRMAAPRSCLALAPQDHAAGRDAQLERAIAEMLRPLDAASRALPVLPARRSR